MIIALDAFGGDNAPLEILKGAAMAEKEYGLDIILCGSEEEIKKCIKENTQSLISTGMWGNGRPLVLGTSPSRFDSCHPDHLKI